MIVKVRSEENVLLKATFRRYSQASMASLDGTTKGCQDANIDQLTILIIWMNQSRPQEWANHAQSIG